MCQNGRADGCTFVSLLFEIVDASKMLNEGKSGLVHVCFAAISIAPALSYPSEISAHSWRGTFIAALPVPHA